MLVSLAHIQRAEPRAIDRGPLSTDPYREVSNDRFRVGPAQSPRLLYPVLWKGSRLE
jgi:hypothetical protein